MPLKGEFAWGKLKRFQLRKTTFVDFTLQMYRDERDEKNMVGFLVSSEISKTLSRTQPLEIE